MAKAKRPLVQDKIDLTSLINACEYHMDMHFNEANGDRDDADHGIYEEAMTAIYVDDVWKEFNKRYDEFME